MEAITISPDALIYEIDSWIEREKSSYYATICIII